MSVIDSISGYGGGSGNYGSASYGSGITPATSGNWGVGSYGSGSPASTITAPTSSSGNSLWGNITTAFTGAAQNVLSAGSSAVGSAIPGWFGTTNPGPGNPVNPTGTAGAAQPTTAAYGTGNLPSILPGVSTIDLVIGVVLIGAVYFLVRK